MAIEESITRLCYVLELAKLEVAWLEDEAGFDFSTIGNHVEQSLDEVKSFHFTAPHGYRPGPTFEKCPECRRYRLKK